ncbi:hypothetical protein FEM48_Zijuj09G0120200 [Ziziphus jujuba var. spinosa]|uniref:Alpha/beta hydrolase fold-3 domain-containing protein n=1 Tax=Ziziphus jujuba var. spinosa TaxID=714518 RepID=A0A978USW5_ZIZJJ|nr:hypothetical protein FEM48_Zijuj09G0120200 [Ziziphus jujuba var. spinosa]
MVSESEIVFEFGPYLRAFKDGRVERYFNTDVVPPSDHGNGVSSKDVQISQETGVSARIFIPNTTIYANAAGQEKLPLLVYFHGGGFMIGSPFCAMYHNHITSLVKEAKIVAVSVDYRLAPEHAVPAAYEDSWAALQWVASHVDGEGPEVWLNKHANFRRVFLAGDSAGGNIVHNMVVKTGEEELAVGMEFELVGACLVHPHFEKKEGDDVDECWRFVCPTTSGLDDPRMNPSVDPRLGRLGCRKVLICAAEKDLFKERALNYYEALRKSRWDGEVELVETEGEEHVFHLFNPNSEKAVAFLRILASFINQS